MSMRKRQVQLLLRAGYLEMKRRQGLQILSLVMGVYLLLAIGVRIVGERSVETDAFMLNLGLTLSVAFGYLLAALTATRQTPEDIEQRSIYPLLARPITRDTLLPDVFVAKHLLPRFGTLQLADRVTAGADAMATYQWIQLAAYALVWLLFCHFAASALFRRRAL